LHPTGRPLLELVLVHKEKHPITVKCHRCDERTEAVCMDDENGSQFGDPNLLLCMTRIDKGRTLLIQVFNTATSIARLRTRQLEGN